MLRTILSLVMLVPGSAFALDCPLDCNAVGGDVNGDAAVDIADMSLLGEYLGGTKRDICERGADVNGDSAIDIADLTVLSHHLWRGGTASADPACDYDPGDVNGDGGVDIGDYLALGQFVGHESMDEICVVQSDLNGNGIIEIGDFALYGAWMFGDGPGPVASCN